MNLRIEIYPLCAKNHKNILRPMAIYTTTTILWFLQSLRNIMRTFPAYFHSMVIIFALRSWLKSANCQICFRFLIELIVEISNDPLLRSRAKQFIDFFQNFWLVHLRHQYVIKPDMKKSNGSRQHFDHLIISTQCLILVWM